MIRSCIPGAHSNFSSPPSGPGACSWAATIPSTWANSTASRAWRRSPSRRQIAMRCSAGGPKSCWAMADLDMVRAARLRRTLAAVAAAHPFYRSRVREIGLAPGDMRSLDALAALPLTRKEDYTSDPEAFRLRPDDLPADFFPEERVLWDVAYTTGTTSGHPSPFYNTAHDAYAIWDQARRCNEAEGLNASDRVANLYPLAGFPTGAFLSVIR